MRKSLITGTKEDVLTSNRLSNKNEQSNRYTKQAVSMAVLDTSSDMSSASSTKRTIITFNHPCIGN